MASLADTLPPVPDADPDVDAVVAEVAEMNSDDWTAVVDNGLVGSPLTLEFRFSAPNEPSALELAEFFTVVEYVAAPAAPESDTDDWTVGGTAPEGTADQAGLAEWVRRMAAAGLAHGGCVLDGWALVLE